MHGGDFFFQAFIYLAAAVIAVPIAKRLGLGSVLGYLLAGVFIGPFGLELIGQEQQDVMQFAEFGVVMMLFLIGLELEPTRVWRLRSAILGLGGLQVAATAAAVACAAIAMGLSWQSALAVGMTLSLSSTAIVMQTLSEKGLTGTAGGQSAFSVLLFQDLAVIPMLAILPLLAGGAEAHAVGETASEHGELWIEHFAGWTRTLIVLGAVGVVVVGGRFLVRPAFRLIARTHQREIFTAAALLLVIGIALLMDQVGLSPALGTFVAGVVLANSEYRHELEVEIEPLKGLLLGLFFIAVGASVDFALIFERPVLILALVAGLIVLKSVVLLVLGRSFRLGLDQNLLFALALAEAGEFAFVLFSFARQNAVLSQSVTDMLVAVVALTMALTPLLLLFNEKVLQPRIGTRERETREDDVIEGENPVIIVGFGNFGSVVGRLLSANGVNATVLDYNSDRVDMLRRLGLKVFYGDASRYSLLEAAGAGSAKLLIVAIGDPKKTLQLAQTARKHFPHLRVLARAGGRYEAYELTEGGMDNVYRDTLDSSLRLGVDALRMLNVRAYHAHRSARTFRRHDEESVRDLATMRHDHKTYINTARQRIQDLEELLLSDLEGRDEMVDVGWDAESLRKEFGNKTGDEGDGS
jgi:monovalent cation:proton antiporter-2 (CPA2) family protein